MARSRAYPVVSLEKAAELASKVVEELGHGSHDRDSLAQAWGYSKGQGLVARKIAALVQFGLMDRDGASYSLSSLADELLHPKSADEEAAAKVRAFSSPTLFAELVAKYQQHGRMPGALANILYRDHGITRQASEEAAGIFLASGAFAGVLSSDGQFTTAAKHKPLAPKPEQKTAPDTDVEDVEDDDEDAPVEERRPAEVRAGKEQPGQQTFQLTLSSGQAALRIPAQLTRQDLVKLRKLLEVVALDVESDAQ